MSDAIPYFPTPITHDWLETLGREWQSRLRLGEWQLHFRVMTKSEVSSSWGLNNSHRDKKIAHISVRDLDDESQDLVRFDPEITLVHELLHCTLTPLRVIRELSHLEEFAIETLANALVAAKRGLPTARIFPGIFDYSEFNKLNN